MDQRDGGGRFDLRRQLMHGVGTDDQCLGAGGFQLARRRDHLASGTLPVPGMLLLGNLGEIEGSQQQIRGMQATQPLMRDLVEMTVVDGGALPAHAADQPKPAHGKFSLEASIVPPDGPAYNRNDCMIDCRIVWRTMWTPDIGHAAGPKYVALANAIAEGARSGTLTPGTRLPPQRALAARLGMNLSTVSKAYDLAAEMGVVAGEVGRGTFVRMLSVPERIPWPKGGGDALDMSSNFPFPSVTSSELAFSLEQLASLPFSADLLKYHPNSAHPDHLAAGAAWLAGLGLETTADRMLLTSGSIHGIFVSLLAVARPGDLILLEEYTSPAIIGACRTLGLRATALPLDAEGIRPDTLEAAVKRERPKALIVVPNLQNPTLAIMSLARRKEIVAIARRHGFVLIEDEVYGPLLEASERAAAACGPGAGAHLLLLEPVEVGRAGAADRVPGRAAVVAGRCAERHPRFDVDDLAAARATRRQLDQRRDSTSSRRPASRHHQAAAADRPRHTAGLRHRRAPRRRFTCS